jgi:hypothetical protein
MEATNKPSQANDYALAKALNELVKGIMVQVYASVGLDKAKDKDLDGLNRAYILLTQELETIYSRSPELQSLKPEPIWRRYDLLKGSSQAIAEYIHDSGDFGDEHNIRVEKLCIIAGVDTPALTPNQRELVKSTEALTSEHMKMVEESLANKESSPKFEYGWQITSYYLTYKPDGTILINDVLKLKKVHAGSITEKLLEQSIKNPNTKFKPNLGKTSRNISTIISSAGFTPVLRDLFFPTANNDTVVFRPYVSKLQADIERIDREELDVQLRENGAICKVIFEPN